MSGLTDGNLATSDGTKHVMHWNHETGGSAIAVIRSRAGKCTFIVTTFGVGLGTAAITDLGIGRGPKYTNTREPLGGRGGCACVHRRGGHEKHLFGQCS